MSASRRRIRPFIVLVVMASIAVSTSTAAAQSVARTVYGDSALGIRPVWNGLAVTRGREHEVIANLPFLQPRGVTSVFVGDSARAYAARAFDIRRRAALFTDTGVLLLAAGALRGALRGEIDAATSRLLASGATLFVVSVPLQFSADAALSRAVWWHNANFSR